MSATTRSLLKLDQAYIAVGGRDHLALIAESLTSCAPCAPRISRRGTEVPSSTYEC